MWHTPELVLIGIMWLNCSALWIALLCLSVQAQIRILTPDTLKSSFVKNNGIINGGTAIFGAPYFGEHVLGRLRSGRGIGKLAQMAGYEVSALAGREKCKDEDYTLLDLPGGNIESGEQIHDIFVIEHGTFCSACQKVRVAQGKGAKAVILIDPSGDDDKKVEQKLLGDDGWGNEVNIPSILVSKHTGDLLLKAMENQQVVVELAWDIPQSAVVSVDFWWSSGSKEAQEFLVRFKESAEVLGHRMQFVPHYYVFDVSLNVGSTMGELCTDIFETAGGVRHCAPDPDGPGPITGADVANEDVRQICLWHRTATSPDVMVDGLYSEHWWNYVTSVYNRCPLKEPTRALRFGSKACSYNLMGTIDIDTNVIDRCVTRHADQLLEESARHVAWSEQALRINGWMYRGALDPEIVLKAVCSGFAEPPFACQELLNGWFRRGFMLLRHRVVRTLTYNTFTWLIVAICFLSVVNCFLYRRHIVKLVNRQMREEVMLEVQSQMADYAKLEGSSI